MVSPRIVNYPKLVHELFRIVKIRIVNCVGHDRCNFFKSNRQDGRLQAINEDTNVIEETIKLP